MGFMGNMTNTEYYEFSKFNIVHVGIPELYLYGKVILNSTCLENEIPCLTPSPHPTPSKKKENCIQ